VVVDEASMIDLAMMCRLVEAVPASARMVIVGDPDQLPSVDTGDVLAALCEASDGEGSPLHAARLHLQHPAPAIARHRRAARGRDRTRRPGRRVARGPGCRRVPRRGMAARQRSGACMPACSSRRCRPTARWRNARTWSRHLQASRAYRVLCALREGPFGAQALNALVGAGARSRAAAAKSWYRGRLVIVTENSYRQQLFNGDIGIAWPDESGEVRVWFDGEGGPRPWLPAALPAHEPAFALTVHKAQGSEFERVLLALPERDARVLTRELLYTGLTRCRREVTLWASEDVLRCAWAAAPRAGPASPEKLGSEPSFSLAAQPSATGFQPSCLRIEAEPGSDPIFQRRAHARSSKLTALTEGVPR
jgi:exodeoxyribonuclease V alpha subunit